MHQPTDRVLRVMEYISCKNQPVSLAELSCDLCILKTTLLPILQTLCDRKYLVKNEAGRYSAGAALLALSGAVKTRFPASDFVHDSLEQLAEKTGETCYFAALRGGDVLYLDKADSPNPLRMLAPIGHAFPAYATALGKTLLAGMGADQLKKLYPNGLAPLTKNTVTDFEQLARQLVQAQENGWSSETEESMEHIRCFAVPVKKQGRTCAAVSVSIPVFRFDPSRQAQIIACLKNEAENISRVIAGSDDIF